MHLIKRRDKKGTTAEVKKYDSIVESWRNSYSCWIKNEKLKENTFAEVIV